VKKKKLFISINIPSEIRENLASYYKLWPEIPARWIDKDNLHLTLFFLGYLSEEKINRIEKLISDSINDLKPFHLSFNCISFGPPNQKKLIWAKLNKSKELNFLIDNIKKTISNLKIENIKKEEDREFLPHVTLAKIKIWEMKSMNPEEIPNINEELSLKFKVNNILLMENKIKRSGTEYKIIKIFKL